MTRLTLLLMPLALGVASACGPSLAELRAASQRASQRAHEAHGAAFEAALLRSVDRAVESARGRIDAALAAFEPGGEAAYRATCRAHLARDEAQAALECLDEAAANGVESFGLELVRADALMAQGEYERARAVLFDLRDRDPLAQGLQERILASFREDEHFLRPVVTLEPGVHLDRIRALGGGSTITLKFKLDDVTIAAFKPDQTRRQSSYRAEVAAYRFCYLMRCGFEVPYSFEVRIEHRQFLRLYGIPSLEGNTGYAAQFGDLIWTREDDGVYLYGVWKDWVPHFTEFPVEYTDVWAEWLAVDGDPALLDAPLEESLAPLRGRERGRYGELLEEAADATTRDLARQISNMLVFDFLINNWDRFSGAYYGVNCQWADGHFVSIDNGAGFMTREPSRPRSHLHETTRFSRSAIQEIRLMQRDELLPILFPNWSDAELGQMDAFWERRQELLDYVDELIETWGEDAVLYFE